MSAATASSVTTRVTERESLLFPLAADVVHVERRRVSLTTAVCVSGWLNMDAVPHHTTTVREYVGTLLLRPKWCPPKSTLANGVRGTEPRKVTLGPIR